MEFNLYDIVKIINGVSIKKNDQSLFFPPGTEGVIVERFTGEYLVEFIDVSGDTHYTLLNGAEILKRWDANSKKYID
ncbi:MAG: hypothetical protein EOP53_22345 [Sphingobacteriales bacterium]|nr:MAG: hypothetical protein EOP53_22345 [Sphingobacteriales bacterium]